MKNYLNNSLVVSPVKLLRIVTDWTSCEIQYFIYALYMYETRHARD